MASRFPKQIWVCIELPRTEYRDAWALQTGLVAARAENRLDRDVVLMLEHPPVFTLGRRGGKTNLTVPEEMLAAKGIPVVQVERGGDITFHGPGQLVLYPIVHLASARLGVADYVGMLESVIIEVAADWGIRAGRNPLNRGVWVGNRKIASIGIAVRRGVSFHGVALNVNLSLDPFDWIHPCGLKGIGMTSMEKELGYRISLDGVRTSAQQHMKNIFGIELIQTKMDAHDIDGVLKAEADLMRRVTASRSSCVV